MFKRFTPKGRFYLRKMRDVQFAIWDMEFKINKSRQVREGVRLDRDRSIEGIKLIEARLQAELPQDEKEKYEAEKKKLEDNALRFEKQMAMIDREVQGAAATEDQPGTQGLMEYLAGYNELLGMLKEEYRKL